jgi:hypothetical protein
VSTLGGRKHLLLLFCSCTSDFSPHRKLHEPYLKSPVRENLRRRKFLLATCDTEAARFAAARSAFFWV